MQIWNFFSQKFWKQKTSTIYLLIKAPSGHKDSQIEGTKNFQGFLYAVFKK